MEERKTILIRNLQYLVKWTLFSLFTGLAVGIIGAYFRKGVDFATRVWSSEPRMILLLPLAGVLIVTWTKILGEEKNQGTNRVIEAVSEGKHITTRTAPLMFVSTIASHMCGASVGKEGAALMIGGSLGEIFSGLFRFDDKDRRIAVMCGMSTCFGAVFGTPLAATLFPMEMISVGILHYAALVPCMFGAFFGAGVMSMLGCGAEVFPVAGIPAISITAAFWTVLFGAACAGVSILFSDILSEGHHRIAAALPNPYVRIVLGGAVFAGLVYLNRFFLGGFDYDGGGFGLVEKAMEGETAWYAFIFKMLFTALAIGAGFKGGEIVPTLAIGACFGSLFAGLFGLNVPLYTACGVAALFAGMTNCPIATLFLAFELFGYEGMPYYLMAIAVSFTLSGYYGLYTSQKFAYSKTAGNYINQKGPRRLWTEAEKEAWETAGEALKGDDAARKPEKPKHDNRFGPI